MTSIGRRAACISILLLTLVLGWQLGARREQDAIRDLERRLGVTQEQDTGTGAVIQNPEHEVDISLLWTVWRLLLKHYIEAEKLQTQPLVFGAVRGMVQAVNDPYTVFMPPEENKEFRDALNGELEGIGAQLALREEKIVVIAPLKGSPAERAGLRSGDIIREVDGVATEGQPLPAVVHRIRGKKGTSVTLLIERPKTDAAITLTIVREEIRVPSVESRLEEREDGTVAVVVINQFGGETIPEMGRALKGLEGNKLRGMILDLRGNGGGYLEGAVDMTSLFLQKGKVVTVQGRGKDPQVHYVDGRPALPDLPLVVLIDQGTASASEIVAGALQDHARANIIGMKSFGKGTVQEVVDLPGGSSLRVTTARWLTPSGRDLGKEGVSPDIVVERTPEQIENEQDPQLDAALERLLH